MKNRIVLLAQVLLFLAVAAATKVLLDRYAATYLLVAALAALLGVRLIVLTAMRRRQVGNGLLPGGFLLVIALLMTSGALGHRTLQLWMCFALLALAPAVVHHFLKQRKQASPTAGPP